MLMTLLNTPAGVCFGTVTLNTALVAFSAIPLIITVGLLLTRDVCGNMETLASKAVAQKAGSGSLPAAVSQFYLNSNPSNSSAGLPGIIKGVNAEYDVEGFKTRVQRSVDDMLKGVTSDFSLRPQVRTDIVAHSAMCSRHCCVSGKAGASNGTPSPLKALCGMGWPSHFSAALYDHAVLSFAATGGNLFVKVYSRSTGIPTCMPCSGSS